MQKVENADVGGDVASGGGVTGGDEQGIVDKKDFREITETPKLQPKPTRHVKERKMCKSSSCL